MASPEDRRYTRTHEWVRLDGDIATIGITDHAQGELGDITYLELPEPGEAVARSKPLGIIESVKAASDIYAPVDGEVVERNEEANSSPELVHASPYDRAWQLRVRVDGPTPGEQLLADPAYDAFAETAG